MKKIYYLLTLIAVIAAFSACRPLNKTYKDLDGAPQPVKTVNYTLVTADYKLLPSTNKNQYFLSTDEANTNIPTILTQKFAGYPDGSNANITFNINTVAQTDSVLADISYTLANPADYTGILGAGAKFIEFTSAQILTWLTTTTNPKFANPKPNQLAILTYIYYESGVTASAIPAQTDAFLYLNGVWTKIYLVTPAQFTSIGNGVGDFSSTDKNIPTLLNAILKLDIGLSLKSVAGDLKYVAYKYYAGKVCERVQPMTFDGTNWTPTQTLPFGINQGVWSKDNTMHYTLVASDYTYIANLSPAVAHADAITNLVAHGNFSQQSGSTQAWSNDEIHAAIVALLKNKYSNTAVVNQNFAVTYSVYTGPTNSVTSVFQYDGTTFNFVK